MSTALGTDALQLTVDELVAMAFGDGLRTHITAAGDPRTPYRALKHLLESDKRMLVQGALVNNPSLPKGLLVEMVKTSTDRYVKQRARYILADRAGRVLLPQRNPFEDDITKYDPDHYDSGPGTAVYSPRTDVGSSPLPEL